MDRDEDRQRACPERCQLNAAGICPEVVVNEVRTHQQGVSGTYRKDKTHLLTEEAFSSAPQYEHHEHGHDQSEQHWAAAREVAQLFFEDRRYRTGKHRKIPSAANRADVLRSSALFSTCGIFTAVPVEQAEAQNRKYDGAVNRHESQRAHRGEIPPLSTIYDRRCCQPRRKLALQWNKPRQQMPLVLRGPLTKPPEQWASGLKTDEQQQENYSQHFFAATA